MTDRLPSPLLEKLVVVRSGGPQQPVVTGLLTHDGGDDQRVRSLLMASSRVSSRLQKAKRTR
jgi:hypothetical protein